MAPAPGNQGMVASTSTSQRRRRAASCCRLNGADSGSRAFGNIFVTTRTRMGVAAAVRMQQGLSNFNPDGEAPPGPRPGGRHLCVAHVRLRSLKQPEFIVRVDVAG